MSVCSKTLTEEPLASESVSILAFVKFFCSEAIGVGGENAVDIGRDKEAWGKITGANVGDDRVEGSGDE